MIKMSLSIFLFLFSLVAIGSCKAQIQTDIFRKCLSEQEYEKVFVKMESNPEFPGGAYAWFKYIEANLLSKSAQESLIQSKILSDSISVKFIVNKQGFICDFALLNSADKVLTESVIEIFKHSPNWNPGKNGSRPVNAYRSVKIKILLDKGKGVFVPSKNIKDYTNEGY